VGKVKIILTGIAALVLITVLTAAFITNRASATHLGESTNDLTVEVVEVKNGVHGSIWWFRDDNRECYFNSSGGIWCTP